MKYLSLFIFLTLSPVALASTFDYDSIGLEKKNGKSFILHKVETQETLYSVSRRYDVSIYKIIESNPPVEYGLEVGQIIRIPLASKENTTVKKSNTTSKSITHIVRQKETLYSLSRQYNVSIDQLKKWNSLNNNEISIGKELIVGFEGSTSDTEKIFSGKPNVDTDAKTHIVTQSETLFSLSKKFDISVKEIKEWNDLTSSEISIGQELIVSEPKKVINTGEDPVINNSNVISNANDSIQVRDKGPINSSTNFEEVTESGLAALIEGSNTTRKYLALHRSAKVGTILRVRNEMNDQEVFVRVLGKLPDTGINKNVVIRISKSAYDRLGAIDPRFRVSLSYIP